MTTRMPALHESAEEAREVDTLLTYDELHAKRKAERAEVTKRRRHIATAAAAVILSPWLVKAGVESQHYGYHAPTPAVDTGNKHP